MSSTPSRGRRPDSSSIGQGAGATPSRTVVGRTVSPSPTRGVVGKEPDGHPVTCICGICTCGRHSCPPQRVSVPFSGAGSHAADYPAHPVSCPTHHGPAPAPRPAVPFDATSMHKTDYPAWPLPERTAPGPAPAARPSVPFQGSSAYKDEYKQWPLEERRSAAPPPRERPHVPFEATTTSASEFKAHPIPARPQTAMSPQPRPRIPFEGRTVSADEFRAWPIEARPQITSPEHRRTADDRDFRSESHAVYTPKHAERCPASLLPPAPPKEAAPKAWEGAHVLWDPAARSWADGAAHGRVGGGGGGGGGRVESTSVRATPDSGPPAAFRHGYFGDNARDALGYGDTASVRSGVSTPRRSVYG